MNTLFVIVVILCLISLIIGVGLGIWREAAGIAVAFLLTIVFSMIGILMAPYLKGRLTHRIVAVILILLFIIGNILLWRLVFSGRLFDNTLNPGVLSRTIGGLVGLSLGILFFWYAICLLENLNIGDPTDWILKQTEGNTVLSFLSSHNPVRAITESLHAKILSILP